MNHKRPTAAATTSSFELPSRMCWRSLRATVATWISRRLAYSSRGSSNVCPRAACVVYSRRNVAARRQFPRVSVRRLTPRMRRKQNACAIGGGRRFPPRGGFPIAIQFCRGRHASPNRPARTSFMIRRCALAVLALSLFAFPFTLSAQSSGSQRTASTALSPSMSASRCAAFDSTDAPGGLGAAATDHSDHGFDLANLDRSVSPCDDFYKFADGGWMKNNPVPADRSTWATYSKLMDRNEEELHGILEEAAKDKSATPGSNWQKIGDYYATCMDESAIEATGIKPLDPDISGDRADQGRAGTAGGDRALAARGRERRFRLRIHTGLQRQHAGDCRGGPGRPRASGPPVLPR